MLNAPDIFPPVTQADRDGFLCYSHGISPALILSGYRQGIFPWPQDNEHVLWFSPPRRCVFEFDNLHIPRSAEREFRKAGFALSVNIRFAEVIRQCASVPRHGQSGTWITPKLIEAYSEIFKLGYAMSFEAIAPDGKLAGGMYGIRIGRFFAGESMFRRCGGASKFALLKGIECLRGEGVTWLDAQVMNPFLKRLGATEITRHQYLKKLHAAIQGQET